MYTFCILIMRVKQIIFILLVCLGTAFAQQKAISLSRNLVSYRKYDQEFNQFRGFGLSMRWDINHYKAERTHDSTLSTTTSNSRNLLFSLIFDMARQTFKGRDKKNKWFFYLNHTIRISPNYGSANMVFREENSFDEIEIVKEKTRLYKIDLKLSSAIEVEYHLTERIFFFNKIGFLSISGSIKKLSTNSRNFRDEEDWQYALNAGILGGRFNIFSVGLIYFF